MIYSAITVKTDAIIAIIVRRFIYNGINKDILMIKMIKKLIIEAL